MQRNQKARYGNRSKSVWVITMEYGIAKRGKEKVIVLGLSPDEDDDNQDWLVQLRKHKVGKKVMAKSVLLSEAILPGYPGEGFHLTQCGTNCRCILRISDLYVTEFEEPEERALAIKVTTREPPPTKTEPVRLSQDTVRQGDKTYIRTVPTRGEKARGRKIMYTQIDGVTGGTKSILAKDLPKDVSSVFHGEFAKTQITKPQKVSMPKPPSAPKPKVIKTVQPSEEVREAMGKTKYDEPEEVRKKLLQSYQQHDELKKTMRVQQDELRKVFPAIKDEYKAVGKTVEEAIRDPKYGEASSKIVALDDQLRAHGKETKIGMRKMVQTSTEGFQVEIDAQSDVRGFEKRVKDSVGEFSKLIDKDLVQKGFFAPVRARAMGARYRSNYLVSERTIQLADKDKMKYVIHEMGHVLEGSRPEVGRAARAFRASRTSGEVPTSLNGVKKTTAFNNVEVTKKDKFIDSYMGRIYRGNATEITSMGLELMYEDPYKFAKKDPEMFDFIYNLVRGRPTGFEAKRITETKFKQTMQDKLRVLT